MTLDRFIRIYDPAIDWDGDLRAAERWALTRDVDALRLRPGQRPVVYHCSRLTLEEYADAMEASNDPRRALYAFRVAVRKIEWSDRSWTPVGVGGRDYSAMSRSEVDEHASIRDVLEIGGQILERATVPTDSEVGYTLRPSSHHAVGAGLLRLLYAAQSQASPPPTASEPAASSEP